MLNDNFIKFQIKKYFVDSNLKIFRSILVSFKFWKCQFHNMKVMTKDKKVNIAVTYPTSLGFLSVGILLLGIQSQCCLTVK
jgi:hypothetical protein